MDEIMDDYLDWPEEAIFESIAQEAPEFYQAWKEHKEEVMREILGEDDD